MTAGQIETGAAQDAYGNVDAEEVPSPLFAVIEEDEDAPNENNDLELDEEEHEESSNYDAELEETNSVPGLAPDSSSADKDEEQAHALSKQRSTTDDSVGAVDINERAPNINLRTFRQAGRNKRSKNRGSLLSRFAQSTRNVTQMGNKKEGEPNNDEAIIEAYLVEEEPELEYAVAEQVSWLHKHTKGLFACLTILVILIFSLPPIILGSGLRLTKEMPSEMPSMAPSQVMK